MKFKNQVPMLPVDDMQSSVKFYQCALGMQVKGKQEQNGVLYWCFLEADGVELMLSLTDCAVTDAEREARRRLMLYFYPDDIEALREHLVQGGFEPGPFEVHFYGMKEFQLRDPSGYLLIFGQETDEQPDCEKPLPVEREAVQLRIERRLLHVMRGLAEMKRMSLGELIEETFMHSFEPVERGGMACPHTKAQLAKLPDLKREAGLDYRTHDTCRFEEKASK